VHGRSRNRNALGSQLAAEISENVVEEPLVRVPLTSQSSTLVRRSGHEPSSEPSPACGPTRSCSSFPGACRPERLDPEYMRTSESSFMEEYRFEPCFREEEIRGARDSATERGCRQSQQPTSRFAEARAGRLVIRRVHACTPRWRAARHPVQRRCSRRDPR
jgi:hypothetical protein